MTDDEEIQNPPEYLNAYGATILAPNLCPNSHMCLDIIHFV